MRIIFMGTPDFSVPPLRTLHESGHEICAVYSQPPRPAGRGKQLRSSPVALWAENMGLDVETPTSLRGDAEARVFEAYGADLAVVVAYGLILPQRILDAPTRGCINIHASLLPRWRGAAPIHRAIMAGDAETGVCIMQMDAGLDTGPVLMRQSITIGAQETTGQLHDRLSDLGADLIQRTLDDIDRLEPVAQDETGVTYAEKINKAEARIDWTRTADEVSRHIRGLSPAPGAWCQLGENRLRCLEASVETAAGPPGTILDNAMTVACGRGSVRLNRIQRAGKSSLSGAEFLRGAQIAVGARLD